MAKIICTVPAHRFQGEEILALEAMLKQEYQLLFGKKHKPTMIWYPLPEGQGYTAGEQAELHLLMIEVDNGLDQALREQGLFAFAGAWHRATGVPEDKIMATLCDSDKLKEYLRANPKRLRAVSRPGFVIGTLVHLATSKLRLGYAAMRANL